MQVLDAHAGFLSNYEVLALLESDVKEQEAAIRQFKRSVPLRKRNSTKSEPGQPYIDFDQALAKLVPDNVRTLQYETLQYLKQPDLPCSRQTPQSIKRTLEAIDKVPTLPDPENRPGGYALTKTEKLMLVNLAPKAIVDLHIIVDELETRFSEESIERFLEIFQTEAEGTEEEQAAMRKQAEEATRLAKQEDEDANAIEAETEEKRKEFEEDIYANEPDDLDEAVYMPDEENDLVDEGLGDGGRDADMREIDEVPEN